jgi:hypothetical protein
MQYQIHTHMHYYKISQVTKSLHCVLRRVMDKTYTVY